MIPLPEGEGGARRRSGWEGEGTDLAGEVPGPAQSRSSVPSPNPLPTGEGSRAWPALLRLAAERFGIPPAAFWLLSLPEWRALTAPPAAERPLSRAELDALLLTHPDKTR